MNGKADTDSAGEDGIALAPLPNLPGLAEGLLEAAPDAMVVVNERGLITLVNARVETVFGYRRAELIGEPVEMLVPEDSRARHAEHRARYAASPHRRETEAGLDLRGRRKDGRVFAAEVSLTPLQTDEGTLVLSAIRDISERKRLEVLAGHLAAVAESSTSAIVSKSLEGVIVSWNPGAERLYGYSEAEAVGQSSSILVADGHDDDVPGLIARILAGERVALYETVRRRRDGSVVDVSLAISAVRDGGGRVVGVSTIASDISEQRRAAAALAQARADIDELFDLSLDMMAVADANGHFVQVNPAFERTLGYVPEELLGQPFVDFTHPADVEITLARYAERTEGKEVGGFENRYRCRDGTYRWLRWSLSALQGGRLFATARDVSERHEIDKALRASREAALEASRLKSEFVANMSHEIRTPLNGVVCMVELLLDSDLKSEQREYAEVAMTSAEALMGVIEDILDFSKIEAGKLEIVHEDYSPDAVLHDVCEIVRLRAQEKGLELAVAIEDDMPEVLRGDAARLRQVLLNLLGNAVKFTAEGEVVIHVRRDLDARGAEMLRFEVADTGEGIAPEIVDTLFEAFSQADATTTRRHGGTGLGLSISRQLVELMGGEIGVESVPGAGSRFWFAVPYVRGSAVATGNTQVVQLEGRRVLIVDDNSANREILAAATGSWGMASTVAEAGPQALELLVRAADDGKPFEVALLDLHMPGMDGLELARAINADPRLRATRRILLSSEPTSSAEIVAADSEAAITKPVLRSQLHDGLVAVLTRARPRVMRRRPRAKTELPPRDAREVLVAEDNEVNQFAAREVLRKLGFNVDIACNGRDAVDMTAGKDYFAVFMDCQMPELDGYAATAAIRRRERSQGGDARHIPIIAMTAHTMAGDRAKCIDAGMDDYLGKPLRARAVQAVCATFATGEALGDARAAPVLETEGLLETLELESATSLVQMFNDHMTVDLGTLEELISASEPDGLYQLAHALKGSAAVLGAPRIVKLCDALSALGTSGTTDGAAELHLQLIEAAADARAAMTAYLDQRLAASESA